MYTAGGGGGGGGGGVRRGEVTKIFDRQRRVANFFLHLLKKEVLFCGFFFCKRRPS